MIADFRHLITQKNLYLELNDPYFVRVSDATQGFDVAKDMLYQVCDKKTALFLSGGRTPKEFYKLLTDEEKLEAGAVGLVDERYGEKWHENSNEQMIRESGLTGYLSYKKTPFYPILQSVIASEAKQSHHIGIATAPSAPRNDISIDEATQQYDETLRFLFNGFTQSIGILGIGLDGHTAGIPINTSLDANDQSFMTSFLDFPGPQKQRISMNFKGLAMLDLLIVLVFGDDKKQALEKMMEEGTEQEIPARFFKRPEIAQKTVVITDQRV